MKKIKLSYEYEELNFGDNQYYNCDLANDKVVDAKYVKSIYGIDVGNPFIEALPPARTQEEIINAHDIPIESNIHYRKTWNKDQKIGDIINLRFLRIPLPFHLELESRFHEAIITSYRSRYFSYNTRAKIPATIGQEEVYLNSKLFGDEGDSTNAGFTMLGFSGCGKSSALKVMLNHYPQVIVHHFEEVPRLTQIVYLVVNCIPNSNFSALYSSIGRAIDHALGNIVPKYEMIIKKINHLGEKAAKVRELIEIFNIAVILFDEIQLIDFKSTKENSFESLMTLSNTTKVAIGIIGTEDAYHIMFSKLRTARRTGPLIQADQYCYKKDFFRYAVNRLFEYQWFNERIEPSNEIIDYLYEVTKGIIDQLIAIYIFMQIDYLNMSDEQRISINKEFIKRVVKKHYKGLQELLKDISVEDFDERRTEIIEKANKELSNYINYNQDEYATHIINFDNEIEIHIKRNVLHNIRICHDEYTNEEVIAAFDKIFSDVKNRSRTEKDLTRLTMKQLAVTSSTPKKRIKKAVRRIEQDKLEAYVEND